MSGSYLRFILILSSIIYSCGFIQAEAKINNPKEAEINKIISIENPNERALYWFLYVYVNMQGNPKKVNQQLPIIANSLWPDDYLHKEAILLVTQAEIVADQGNYKKTHRYVLDAIQLLESKVLKSDAEKKILCMMYLAFTQHSVFSKAEQGLEYAYKGLSLASDINFVSGQVLAHNQIGLVISHSKKDYLLALSHFTQAEGLLPQLPRPIYNFISGFIIGNIAEMRSILGDYNQSIQYKLQLLDKENINTELLLTTLNNLSSDYLKLKEYGLAAQYSQRALDIMKKNEILKNRGLPLLRKGLVQIEKGNVNEAINYAEAIDNWLITHKFSGNHKVSFYQLKSKIANAKKDYKKAIYWLKEAATEQSKLQKKMVNNLVELETNSKLKEIEQERLMLEKEKEIHQTTINTQKLSLIGISLALILSLWFGVTFYEKNKEIKEAYDYILSQNKTKEQSDKKIIKTNENASANEKNVDQVLKQKIFHALTIDKSFLSPDLTLKKFADLVNSNTSYVSKTINDGFGKNFGGVSNVMLK